MNDNSRSTYFDNARAMLHPHKFSHLMTGAVPDAGGSVSPPDSATEFSGGIMRRHATGDRVTPIFLAHPHYDDIVPYSETIWTVAVFRAMGWEEINLEAYPLDDGAAQQRHWLNVPLGVDHLAQWLKDRLRNCPYHPRGGHVHDYRLQQLQNAGGGSAPPELGLNGNH